MAREGSLGRRTHDEPAVFEQFGIRSDVAGAMPRFAGGLVEWRLEEYQTRYGVPSTQAPRARLGYGWHAVAKTGYQSMFCGVQVKRSMSLCHFVTSCRKCVIRSAGGEKDVRSRSQVQSSPPNDPNPSPGWYSRSQYSRLRASCVVRCACVRAFIDRAAGLSGEWVGRARMGGLVGGRQRSDRRASLGKLGKKV